MATTQVFYRSRKKTSQGSIGPCNTPNSCKPEKDSQQKFTFHACSNHVLISNITSLKRQMQRQVRTGHFHVNSKEEWNKLYDGVNIRAQSDRQFTQDLRQWHYSSIEAEKNISQGSIGLHNTPKACKSEQDSQQKFTFYICLAHVLFPNITSIKRQMQRQEKTGHFHVNSKKEWNNAFDGVNHRVQSNRQLHKTYGNDTSLPSKQKKNLTRKHWTVQHAKYL